MTLQTINIGGEANDGTGDSVRDAFDKSNLNFAALGSAIQALQDGGSAAPISGVTVFQYANDATGMTQAASGSLALGQMVMTYWFDSAKRRHSNGWYRVHSAAVGGENTLTVGRTVYDTSVGELLIEGRFYRFAPISPDGHTYPLGPLGIAGVDNVTGWTGRMEAAVAFAKAKEVSLSGSGTLFCTETVTIDRARCTRLPRFRAADKFFSVQQVNTAVVIDHAMVASASNHGAAVDSAIVFSTAGTLPAGIVAGTTYYLVNPATGTFSVATSLGGAPIRITDPGRGVHTFTANGGASKTVIFSAALDPTVQFPNHGFIANKRVMVSSTRKLPANLAILSAYYVVNVTANTFQLATEKDGAPIVNGAFGAGAHYVYYSPHHATIQFGAPGYPINPLFVDDLGNAVTNSLTINGVTLRLVPQGTAAAGGQLAIGATGAATATLVANHLNANLATYGLTSVTLYNSVFIGLTGPAMAASRAGAGFNISVLELPEQNNIKLEGRVQWSGKTRFVGYVVRAAQNGDNTMFMEQALEVWGDGDLEIIGKKNWAKIPTTAAVCHGGYDLADDSANGDYRYSIANTDVGVVCAGGPEKHRLQVHGIKARILLLVPQRCSTDTLEVELHGNDCFAWCFIAEGVGTSLKIRTSVESRCDPRRDASNDNEGFDSPAFWDCNGKMTTWSGMVRANNGIRCFVGSGSITETGTAFRGGFDTIQFDEWRIIHGYGIAIELRNGNYATGKVVVSNWFNPFANQTEYVNPTQPEIPAPCFLVGSLRSGAGLELIAFGCVNSIGTLEGYVNDNADPRFAGPRADGLAYYSINADLGRRVCVMGSATTDAPSFNADLYRTERPESGMPPARKFIANHINMMRNCTVDVSGGDGDLFVGANVQGNSQIVIGSEFNDNNLSGAARAYQITKATAASATIGARKLELPAGVTVLAA